MHGFCNPKYVARIKSHGKDKVATKMPYETLCLELANMQGKTSNCT